eukprot:scaffold3319_cov130-Alexandrium_tamarense.AAC.2
MEYAANVLVILYLHWLSSWVSAFLKYAMVDAIHSKVEVRVRVIRASEKQNYAISVHVCFATFSTRHHLLNTFAAWRTISRKNLEDTIILRAASS